MSIARLPLLLSCLVLAAACAPPDGGSDSTAVQEEASARLSPRSASAGVPRVVEIWGENTDWTASDIRVDFGQGVEATVVTANSSFHLTVQLLVAEQAALGPRDVRISWADRTVLLRDAFVIEPGSIAISPGHAALGETVAVEISGWRTNFQAAYTTLSLGPEIELVDFEVLSTSLLRAVLHVPLRSAPGAVDVVVYNPGGEFYTLADGFEIDRTSRSMSISPDEADQGEVLDVAVLVEDGELVPGGTTLDMGTGVVVEELEVISPDKLSATIRIGNNAAVGARDVAVHATSSDGAEVSRILVDGFTIWPVEPDPLRARVSLSFGISRIFQPDECSFDINVYATAVFYEPNDFPCPSSGSTSTLSAPPHFDTISSGFSTSGGSTDCPTPASFDAGPLIWFEGEDNVIELERSIHPFSGRITYRAYDLLLEDYRADSIYDLQTSGGDLGFAELPPWHIDTVLQTLPRVYEQHGPDYCGLEHPIDEPLTVQWDPAQTYDEAEMYLYLLGSAQAQGTPLMMVYPWDDGEFTYSPEQLSFFIHGPALLLQSAYKQTRFDVPGAEFPNSGIGTSALMWRGYFDFDAPD